ncbi:MAG: hypothetical protein ACP5N7_00480 [Candidatus Pacearchaeota archaeon]
MADELNDGDKLFDILIDFVTNAIRNGELFDTRRLDGLVTYFHRNERSVCYLLNEEKQILDSIYRFELIKFSFDKKSKKKTFHINGVDNIIYRVQDKFYNTNQYDIERDLTEVIETTQNDLGLDFEAIDELEIEILACEEIAEERLEDCLRL